MSMTAEKKKNTLATFNQQLRTDGLISQKRKARSRNWNSSVRLRALSKTVSSS